MSETKEVELPKTMLILKSNVTALGTVETFLRNRGWKIFSTANLKEALVQIVKNKPSYVLISVDHPNKKVRALPKLLSQAFPVATIVFAENQSSSSYKVLNEAATEYRVYPPVTGPAIERCVNKYLKDQQTKMTVESANDNFKGDGTNNGNDTISIKGGGDGNISIKAESGSMGGDASRLFSQFLNEDGANGTAANASTKNDDIFGGAPSSSSKNESGQFGQVAVGGTNDDLSGNSIAGGKTGDGKNAQVGSGKQDNNLVFAQPMEEDESSPSQGYVPGGNPFGGNPQDDIASGGHLKGNNGAHQDGKNGFGKTYVQKGSSGETNGYIPPTDDLGGWGNAQGEKTNGRANSSQQDGPGSENGWGQQGNDDLGDGSAADQMDRSGTAHDGMGSREYRRRQAAAAAWAPATDMDELRKRDELRARSDANETLIARGTQKSLEESVDRGDGVIKEKLQDTTSAACIMVESDRFSGYLVAVMGQNKKIDTNFIEMIKQRLFKFLKDNGEDVADNNSMDVKIRQVDFEPWALEYADFLRKSVHQGSEVVMAFFPRRPIKAILEDSHHQDMAKIDLKELQGDRQVEFDLYVYLPTNNKYVLYTPKGGVFYNKQMDRLKKQGVTHMHIQKAAVQAVSKYQAQNYLNDMVEDYEQKQELAAKIKAA
ncbi:hypothetical protein [Bdellovibrio sp. HCB337]|uniref:hypothetical protein n=1 Tax=Bdellovibrio sp. HCB337 TaxID=3394358 RepID=UPI0039A43AA6